MKTRLAHRAQIAPVPAGRASGFHQLRRSFEISRQVAPGLTVLPTLVVFGVGYGVIAAFMKFVITRSHVPSGPYRIVLGLIVLGLLRAGVLSAL